MIFDGISDPIVGAFSDNFHSKLDFKVKIITYEGDDSWVQKTVLEIFSVLNSDLIPEANPKCELCGYVSTVDLISS